MRERPILFSGEMVRRILDGSKTKTRRIVQSPAKTMQREGMEVIKRRAPGHAWYRDCVWSMRNRMGVWGDYTHEKFLTLCPYGMVGDRLWVRETWAPFVAPDGSGREGVAYRATCGDDGSFTWVGDDGGGSLSVAEMQIHRWRPAIHMPRWASRIALEVTGVGVERLQAITPEDVAAEGVTILVAADTRHVLVPISRWKEWERTEKTATDAIRLQFAELWDGINGKRAPWSRDPWVWVVSFRRVQP